MARRRTKRAYPKWEELETEEILSQYPDQFLDCRGNHNWGRRPIYKLIGPDLYEVSTACECGTTKKYWWNKRTRRQVREPYTYYPPGYQTPRTGLTRADFKGAFHDRDFERASRDGRVFRGTPQEDETGLPDTGPGEIIEPKGDAA